jgi:ABC-2 type transport system permease protein
MSAHAIAALVKKELLEIVGDPYSRRGGFIQAGVMTVVLGVLIPASTAALWLATSPAAIAYYALFPGVVAAAIAADAFAGERERRTLETLLATPLEESTILIGKVSAAVIWALTVAALALVVGTVVVNVSAGTLVPSPLLVLGALGASLASGTFMASMATVVSMLIPAARPAQQVASLGSMAIVGGGLAAWKAIGLAVVWTNAFLAEGAVLIAGIIVLEIGRALFRRDRFFKSA